MEHLVRRRWQLFWPPLAYLALALVMTWPLALQAGNALHGAGDPQLQAWILAWNAHVLRTDPGAIWQAPIFFPYPDTLAYTDNHILLATLSAPLLWLSANPVLVYNLLVLLSFVLSGWAVYGLVHDISGRRLAAFVAGTAFAFCHYRFAQVVHLQLLQTAWLPWALLFLRRLLQPPAAGGGQVGHALLFGLFAGIQCVTALYYAFFTVAVLGGYVALWALAAGWQRARGTAALPWRQAGLLGLGGLVAALVTLPLTWPYLGVYRTLGIVRSVRELDHWSAPLTAYLAGNPQSLLYSRLGEPFVASGEMVLAPGFLVLGLGLLALLQQPRREVIFWGLVAAAAFVLSFGTAVRFERDGPPLAIPLPYELLYTYLPGFGALRVPARWGMLVTLALAVLAGITISAWQARWRGRRAAWIGVTLLGLVLLEQASLPQQLALAAPLRDVPPVYGWLGAAEQDDIDVVLELPVGRIPRGEELQRITQRQFYSVQHWKALPVAFSGLIPFGTTELLAKVQSLPARETLEYLQITGVDTLVIHRNEADPEWLAQLTTGLDASGLAYRRAEVGAALVYTLRPFAGFAAEPPGGARGSVYISADERIPGILTLGAIRHWQAAGYELYGPGRNRFYAALRMPAAGQVFDYGLLADSEEPERYGFTAAGLGWQSNGLAFYARDPQLRANVALAQPVPGAYHPAYPAQLEVAITANEARIGATTVALAPPLTAGYLELDLVSLAAGSLRIGAAEYTLQPGFQRLQAPLALEQATTITGDPQTLALLQARVGAAPPPAADGGAGLAARADARFAGSVLRVAVTAGGGAEVLLDVRGAAALDDRPIHLLAGVQALPTDGGDLLFEVDLLDQAAPWLIHSEAAQDGRYIVYLKDAAQPYGPGRPVAQFRVRGGALVDAAPVPLPLTVVR